MSTGDILGFIGGALVNFSIIPQIIRVFRLKSAREISLTFTVLMLVGIIVWFAYGIYFRLLPIIMWNIVGAVLTSLLLYAKLKYGRE